MSAAIEITMPRGDLKKCRFWIKNEYGEASDIEFDEIYFTVKRNFYDQDFIFQKKLSDNTIVKLEDGSYQFVIEPADTNDCAVGRHVCDIEIVEEGSIKQTVVGTLDLTNEVTYARNEV